MYGIFLVNKDIYDVMEELLSSVVNKSVEILKYTASGGSELKIYLEEFETLIK